MLSADTSASTFADGDSVVEDGLFSGMFLPSPLDCPFSIDDPRRGTLS
jgi:hypothetical protein